MTGTDDELARPGVRDVLGPLIRTLDNQPELPVAKLSGGETRRIHVANGLASLGDVILLDEITTGLDGPSAETVLRTALGSDFDYVFAVAHDLPASATDLGFTHVLEIRDGQVVDLRQISAIHHRSPSPRRSSCRP